jgi:23S rRNA (adenine2503-C2)-methyltransferase
MIHTATAEKAEETTPVRQSLIGMPKDEMEAAFKKLGLPRFRVKQVWNWLYRHGVTEFGQMKNFARTAQEQLAEHYTLERSGIEKNVLSVDGTRKWLLKLHDGNLVETVHIPETDRGTLCVSSQVGCTLSCTFCHTGTQRLVRNLTAEEIVGQIMLARDGLEDWPAVKEPRLVSNIVMMGMGEPLYNYDEVAKAITIMMDGEGLGLSKRRITLSTSGVVPMIERCGKELGVNLAISLHAVRDDLRNEIVPLNKKYPIHELLDACRNYPGASNARRITFEYVMLKGVNDSDADAHELVRLMEGIPAKINLIPFNPWPGAPYECSSNNRIRSFSQIVLDAGYASPVRTPRGRDIGAACGQLKSASERQSKSKLSKRFAGTA